MSSKRKLLLGYLVLLAASTWVRSGARWNPGPGLREREVVLLAVDGERHTADSVRIAIFDSAPPGPGTAPALVLLHGSPGDNGEVIRLARAMADRYRVIAPDLPGFGGSTRRVPDYSIRAHARYVADLLDSLGVARAHILGFSMGGGVALNLADIAPARVASITMLSAIGAQEFELLGDYHLNHAIHGLQLGGLWAVFNLIPHFGALDGGMLSLEYARNFYDSDQRPLRGIMARLEQPMLVIQGRADPLVPAAIAEEHHRIVPQSELLLMEGDHFMAFQRAGELARAITDFIDRAEAGRARTRSNAPPDRVAQARLPLDPAAVPRASGIGFAVLVLLLALATLVSEDFTCIATGLLVSRGTIGFFPGVLACFVGIVAGDLLLYLAGRFLGRGAMSSRILRWVTNERDLERTAAWFVRRGPVLVLTSRFVPGTRLPTYLAAGILRAPLGPFAAWFVIAAALWTPLLVGLSMVYGEAMVAAFGLYTRWSLPLLAAAGLGFLFVVKLVTPLCTWRGRRLLWGRWLRLTRWEFWPPWALYLPIVPYILWLGVRHRSLTLFTAANPGMPAGGFIGESKWEILQRLGGRDPRLPATLRLDPSRSAASNLDILRSFFENAGLTWPLVLKPDAGERGRGVAIVRTPEEALRHIEGSRELLLAQEYLPGREYGLFYYRMPGESRGRIFSVTDKRFPGVVGDGARTLERLILDDPRAVAHASLHLAAFGDRLWTVPARGERIPLVQLGTHCRGATFLDGSGLITEALTEAVDAVSRRYEGFWFGRYDVRAPSEAEFQAGRFRVVELNGVTSEATSIYDPSHSVWFAWRTLAAQWRLCFEIAARNRRAGAEPAGVRALVTLLRQDRPHDEIILPSLQR